MQDQDLLQGYEIKNWEFNPRFYKIIAASTILTLLPIFVLGQANLFSTSACKSPFVSNVCEVLDTVYVGAKILAKDTGYEERAYEDVQLRESNEVVWLDETNVEPQLEYPEGYFEIANRDELRDRALAMNNPDAGFANITPGIPSPIAPPSPRIDSPIARNNPKGPTFPSRRKGGVLKGDIDDDPLAGLTAGNDDDDKGEKPAVTTTPPTTTRGESKKPENPLDKETAKQSEKLKDLKINRQPLYDFADVVLERVDAKVDLTKQFKVTMKGVIDENGMLDQERSQFTEMVGDEEMLKIAKLAVEKVGVSGWLKYLADEDANRLDIVFGQNEEQLIANVVSDLKDANKAKKSATALRSAISLAIILHNSGTNVLKDDELLLLKSVKITNDQRYLKVTFNLDKPVAHPLIKARLAEYRQKKIDDEKKKASTGSPSGSVEKPSSLVNAGR